MPPPHPTKQPADGPISRARADKSAHRPRNRAGWDREIAGIANRQHGLISLEQLEGLGVDRKTAHARVDAGRLHRVHCGVYSVGHAPLTKEARYLAAVLACGPDAVLSHRAAADLLGIRENRRARIDVTAPGRRGRAPRGIDAHRDGSLAAADRMVIDDIPCTSVARMLLDFAGVEPVRELRKAVREAEVKRILDKGAVRELIKRSRGRRGVARLRMVLDEIHPETRRTRSYMESLFLEMCTRAELPRPEVNVSLRIGNDTFEPDFLWRDAGLIVEADSRQFHDTDLAFLDDRRREQRLQLAGWRVSHCTWWEIKHESRRLAETTRGLLALG
ncbi:MAG: type IV toxin-antitoxin system AbiEi family antitoxin domain-containing protein [Solirubrobacterales bacterium]